MANTFKLKTKASVGITTTSVYVVPSSTTTVVIGITASNISGNNINVGIGITRASTDDVHLMKNVPIPQGSSFEFMAGNKIVLETTTKQVKYSILYMKAIKALQEAITRIETLEQDNIALRARVTNLEGN